MAEARPHLHPERLQSKSLRCAHEHLCLARLAIPMSAHALCLCSLGEFLVLATVVPSDEFLACHTAFR